MALVGNPPLDLGLHDHHFDEMMFWMYCPISVPGSSHYVCGAQLRQFAPLINACRDHDPEAFEANYAYVTAKTLWVEGQYIGNRPGWHTDGFGTDDVNYIWSDRAPTEFFIIDPVQPISDDCEQSMMDMECLFVMVDQMSPYYPALVYEDKHLLRLDPTVMHRCPVGFEPGMRTFFKLSLSKDRYNLKGNAVNYLLPETNWPLVDRVEARNHPAKEA